jgi:hypothetical protein
MTSTLEQNVQLWLVMSTIGFAVGYFGAAMFARSEQYCAATPAPSGETLDEANLAIAIGAMADEGGPAGRAS